MTTTNESSIKALYRVIREDGSYEDVEMPLYNTMDERLAMARTKVSGNIERVMYMHESHSSTTAPPPADGGPAFPSGNLDEQCPSDGLSLRDYFAAKAMQGLIGNNDRGLIDMPWVAEGAYKIADAMLKARG